MVDVTTEAIFVGCNRVAGCLSWGYNGIVLYGGGSFVVMYDTKEGRPTKTLVGHKGRVNDVKWIPTKDLSPETELISSSSDKTIKIWKKTNDWECIETLEGHSDIVNNIDCVVSPDGSLWIVSCSGDCTVRIWKREENKSFQLIETLDKWRPKMVESVSISLLPNTNIPIIAAGAVDSRIYLFTSSQSKFFKAVTLQGHEDWIRCLSFTKLDNGDLLLASGSQDSRIRLWKVTPLIETNKKPVNNASELLTLLAQKINEDTDFSQILAYHQRENVIDIIRPEGDKLAFNVVLESVLLGHDEWVHSIHWHPKVLKDGKIHQPLSLLSSSMDRTLVLWEPDEDSEGLWIEKVKVGEVGGNTLGFYGGCIAPGGEYIIGHGYTGALHLWKKSEEKSWDPIVTVSGHFNEVWDLSWDPQYKYLISVSKDQTTRVWGEWYRPNNYYQSSLKKSWNELARPQVHGHDIICLAFINGVYHSFVSGSEEKMLRLFVAPKSFIDSIEPISKITTPDDVKNSRPLSATVPPLGLSNKPYDGNSQQDDEPQLKTFDEDDNFDENIPTAPHEPLFVTIPPFEEQLIQRTLWAEKQKLYGHGNELQCVTCNYKGTLLASACEAKSAEHAAIKIWDTKNWKSKISVQQHKLDVQQLEFSHNDKYLLSVSRGRTIGVIEVKEKENGEVEVVNIGTVAAHGRIVMACSWSPDDRIFATGSRDIKSANVKFWTINEGKKIEPINELQLPSPVTAIAFAPVIIEDKYIVALGLGDGSISLWESNAKELKEWKNILYVDKRESHVAKVSRIRWRLLSQDSKGTSLNIATSSYDHSIRIFSVNFSNKK